MLAKRIYQYLINKYRYYVAPVLYRFTLGHKVKILRRKDCVNVLFVLTEIGTWKTRMLYLEMLGHPRFNPKLGVSTSAEKPSSKLDLMEYLTSKKYDYLDLDIDTEKAFAQISPDIIFYQKPYKVYQPEIYFYKHRKALFCHATYGFHSIDDAWAVCNLFYRFTWQQYFENVLTVNSKCIGKMFDGKKQALVTGLPVMDLLLQPKEMSSDPWKPLNRNCKRIIYAPHHTIAEEHVTGFAISSFLETGEIMRQMMHKYADRIQWCFKPHPLLYAKLVKIWGKDRADEYYNDWKTAENSQFEDGEYDALFKYSDAMIHDCCSFTIEYHYTHNPVLFLIRQEGYEANRNEFARKAFDLHYKGHTEEEIDGFIRNVLDGVDPLKEDRQEYFDRYLLPPNGKSACQNIINAILGQDEYSKR